MQIVKTLFLCLSIGVLPTFLFCQSNSKTYGCYIDSIKSDEKVFHKIQLNASFKGGPNHFKDFLLKHVNHSVFISELSKSKTIYSDTAKVKFVISRRAIMSNLHIKGTQNDIFKREIEKALKQSSCFWVPGEYSGQKVNGWYQIDIFYFIELIDGELKIKINYKSHPYADSN